MQVKKMKTADLRGWSRNPRTISDDAMRGLEASVQRFGLVEPIIWNERTNRVVGGHQRLKVLKRNKIKETDVVVVDMPAADEMALNVALNNPAIAGVFTDELPGVLDDIKENDAELFESLKLGDIEIPEVAGPKLGDIEEDEVPEPPKTPVTKPGDVWTLGRHTVVCGDCSNTTIDKKSNLLLTDPPYNVASETKLIGRSVSKAINELSKSQWDVNFDLRKHLESIGEYILKDSTAYVFTSQFLAPTIWEWMSCNFDFYSWCAWDKPNPMPSLSGRHWTWSAELVCYATRGRHTFNNIKGQHQPSIWRIAKKKQSDHPTEKPVEVMATPMVASSKKGDVVLDPFLGSGTTLIAAEQLDRVCYGIEIEPKYCDVIVERWENLTGQKAKRK